MPYLLALKLLVRQDRKSQPQKGGAEHEERARHRHQRLWCKLVRVAVGVQTRFAARGSPQCGARQRRANEYVRSTN